ncbi:helix-turn-helix domain-containing protein [Amycolatopsis sp. NEAU-NG30]|uniref:Helix-turn-helix domain-containing protein n=1 Tax=Amycolatopsis melonis TaxID=3156488 RepID=A0ABV0LCY7_9PSEU
MKGLLLRLSGLDADAENAVRLIGFFDRLITGRAGLDTLVRSTAELAGCPVGVHAPGQGTSLRADPEIGAPGPPPPGAATRTLEGGVVVWVDRAGTPAPLDDMLLERFAIATAILLEHSGVPRPELGDPALVELLLSADAGAAERSRALHLLGYGPQARLRVVAAIGADGLGGRAAQLGEVRAVLIDGEVPESLRDGGPVGTGRSDGQRLDVGTGRSNGQRLDGGRVDGVSSAAVRASTGLAPATDRTVSGPGPARATNARELPGQLSAALPDGARAGVGPELPGLDAARSWAAARTALRFTAAAEPVVWWERLGSLAAFDGKLGDAELGALPDVQALDRLAGESHGEDILAALSALCATGSARKAAAVLHRHHSTMPARLARAEAVLGFDVDSPGGRFRLHLALMLRRLRDNAGVS